jgi:hypothetical protein
MIFRQRLPQQCVKDVLFVIHGFFHMTTNQITNKLAGGFIGFLEKVRTYAERLCEPPQEAWQSSLSGAGISGLLRCARMTVIEVLSPVWHSLCMALSNPFHERKGKISKEDPKNKGTMLWSR